MVEEEVEDKVEQAYKDIINAVNGIPVERAIALLEEAKLDILLNRQIILVDGRVGLY